VLFAHRSVERNVSFPLELRRQHIDEIRRRVGAEVRALHLEHLLERPSGTLSRGEAQLVQIARAMVRLPNVLLLDEPLATLDDSTRRRMQGELSLLQDGYGVTTMMATNDADDAMRMATRLVVLGAGRVVQVGTPAEVRRSPATFDAAVSTGECWQIRARVEAGQEGFWLVRDGRPVGTSSAGTSFRHRAWAPALADRVGEEVIVGLRPHDVAVAADGPVPAMVTRVIPGQSTTLVCDVAGCPVGVHTDVRAAVGDAIRLRIDRLTVFDASSGFAIV
jgi:ABC-type sugar transport system ATPase subunit